jgi:hypothetical protein
MYLYMDIYFYVQVAKQNKLYLGEIIALNMLATLNRIAKRRNILGVCGDQYIKITDSPQSCVGLRALVHLRTNIN